MKRRFFSFLLPGMFFLPVALFADVVISEISQECIDCHETIQPGLFGDWRSSRHAGTTPAMALAKPATERRVSSATIPGELKNTAVACYECHGLNTENHKDAFEHNGYTINVVVSPKDCATCHAVETKEYSESKKAHAIENLSNNAVYSQLVGTVLRKTDVHGKGKASQNAKNGSCFACHGTEIIVDGMRTIETEDDEIEVPKLLNWPNQGVGRINPDGSKGACSSCHPRHSFSIEVARKPHTCGQCHLEPDVPAFNVYKESKHGNIYSSLKSKWNWNSVPWHPGKDFQAPTCATCHNSLLADVDGEVIINRTHNFGSRLWKRIFGLIYSHPQPEKGATHLLKNQQGLPLPTTFTGEIAASGLINQATAAERKNEMTKVCTACHSTRWASNHFAELDIACDEADAMVLTATQLLQQAWDEKLASAANPFDETIEQLWIEQWLFYANSLRYARAMMGPDYASFKNGWWELNKNISHMQDWLKLHKKD